jgi:hypothetical protein
MEAQSLSSEEILNITYQPQVITFPVLLAHGQAVFRVRAVTQCSATIPGSSVLCSLHLYHPLIVCLCVCVCVALHLSDVQAIRITLLMSTSALMEGTLSPRIFLFAVEFF